MSKPDFVGTEERRSINFEFLLGTDWEQYYDRLLSPEIIFHDSLHNSKIYIDCRVIAEKMARRIRANLFGQNQCDTFDNNLYVIRGSMPENIKEYFYNIKHNGNVYSHPEDVKKYTDTPQQVLRELYICLKWYFQTIEKNPKLDYQVEFKVPNHEVGDLERAMIIERQRREIDEAKNENVKIENKYRKQTEETDRKIFELNRQLEEARNDSNKIVDLTERKLLKQRMEEHEEELQISRRENELLKDLLKDLAEFNAFKDVNKIGEINNLEGSISEEVDDVGVKIEKTSREIKRLKDIFNENQNISNSKYPLFYTSLLNLEGEQLRQIYATLDRLNIGTVLINTAKNKISKSEIDAMQTFIDTEARKLNRLNDKEIQLKLYYKLLTICGIRSGCIAN
ncbi:MAG: hypothetical protein ABRQ24_03820 [Syntrophomonadaceae bacterium]